MSSPRRWREVAARSRLSALLAFLVAATGTTQVHVVSAEPHHDLQPEDRIVGWRVATADGVTLGEGPIRDSLELVVTRTEQGPRGEFMLVLADGRASGPVRFADTLVTRPDLPTSLERLYLAATEPPDASDTAVGDARSDRWVELAEALDRRGRHADALWAWGGAIAVESSLDAVLDLVERARGRSSDLPARFAGFLRLAEKALQGLRQPPDPHRRALLEEALALDQARRPGGLSVAADLYALGVLDGRDGQPALGEERLREAVRIYEATNPDSLYLAEAMYRLSLALSTQGRLEEELEWNRRELALVERIGVTGEPRVRAMQAIGGTLTQLGRVFEAREALAAASQAASADASVPDGLRAAIEQALAVVALDLGDVAASEVHALRALDFVRRDGAGGRHEVPILSSLAIVYTERRDWDAADARFAEALAIVEQLAPRSRIHAMMLNNRANAASLAGRLEAATEYVTLAEEIIAEVAPESLTAAKSKIVRAQIASSAGDVETSVRAARESLEEVRRDYAGTFRVGRHAMQLGHYLLDAGDLDEAQRVFEEAVEIFGRTDLGVMQHARALNGLGLAERGRGRPHEAARRLCEAAEIVDRQRLGMGFDRSGHPAFSRIASHYYHDCADALIEVGEPSRALDVVDRARSRDLLVLLADRRLAIDEALPEELRSRRERLNERYDALFAVAQEEPGTGVEERRLELDALRREQLEIERLLRAERTSLARLPAVADLGQVLEELGPRTALITYSVGENETLLLVAAAVWREAPVRVWRLPVGRKTAQREVQEFAAAIAAREDVGARATAQWRRWLGPAMSALDSIEALERVVVAPDGPLHVLPFAALRDAEGRYLIERWSLVVVGSGALLRELRQRGSARTGPVVAFVDPTVAEVEPIGRVSLAVRSGLDLVPLPAARREAAELQALMPGKVRTFVGAEATEARFKEMAPQARWLHVASHGFFDPRAPLDSGIVLAARETSSDVDNGFLQAWEIFEDLRLRADLVTLSACETGLGEEAGTEGVIGLTRAFQAVGARSVVASLWQVADASTADFMVDFYRNLRAGGTKDEALRAAQLASLRCCASADASGSGQEPREDDPSRAVGGLAPTRSVDRSHPYFWAAFQLFGDWQ